MAVGVGIGRDGSGTEARRLGIGNPAMESTIDEIAQVLSQSQPRISISDYCMCPYNARALNIVPEVDQYRTLR